MDCSRRTVHEAGVIAQWERGMVPTDALDALDVQVIFRGVPSDGGGPDYQDALLHIRGAVQHGDVEFHQRSSDWYRHGHHRDPAYNRVVLHVVGVHDAPTHREDGREVPVLALGLPQPAPALLIDHPCPARMAACPDLSLAVRAAGHTRFRLKVDLCAADLQAVPADEVAYRLILESLGYASNRESFRRLAEAAPYAWVSGVDPDRREVALLDAARLGPSSGTHPPVRLPAGSWRLSRLRPANHPAVRLRGLAALSVRFGPRLSDALVSMVAIAARPSDLRKALTVYSRMGSPIGPGRADEMAVSAVLPFVAAVDPDAGAEKLFTVYPSPPQNRWTREVIRLAAQGGIDFKVRRALDHQGAHHLYHTHCRYDRRRDCPVCG